MSALAPAPGRIVCRVNMRCARDDLRRSRDCNQLLHKLAGLSGPGAIRPSPQSRTRHASQSERALCKTTAAPHTPTALPSPSPLHRRDVARKNPVRPSIMTVIPWGRAHTYDRKTRPQTGQIITSLCVHVCLLVQSCLARVPLCTTEIDMFMMSTAPGGAWRPGPPDCSWSMVHAIQQKKCKLLSPTVSLTVSTFTHSLTRQVSSHPPHSMPYTGRI